ncbi:unnamed protein product [Adineta steineri]|uniref:Reverse transcriptase RNase H-like domain-containing protein n=1 Tax=Adineta steineri TaxID=433720 RepID=A0A814CML2_9BILA|nr:unnamed protein product [Adineta steineri]CAF4023021.1 unnamed protein product [Adineta steineri]
MEQKKAITHVSKTYTSTEVNYGQIEKEALAFICGIQKFDQFLHRRHVILLTHHKPLLTILDSKKGNPSALASRLQNWALRLMGYTKDIEYRSTNNLIYTILMNCLLWCSRTIMSSSFRNQLFEHLHSLHSGMGRMQAAVRRYCGGLHWTKI